MDLKPGKAIAYEEIEEIHLSKTGIIPAINLYEIQLYGTSDFVSSRTVLESLMPKKVIFTNDSYLDSLFLSSYFAFNNTGIKTYICDREIYFNSFSGIQKALVSEKVMELNKKKLVDKYLLSFRAIKNANLIDYIGNINPIVIGSINTELIRKSLIELGFQVETIDNKLIVNESLQIVFDDCNLSISSNEKNLLVSVREVLYKYICIV